MNGRSARALYLSVLVFLSVIIQVPAARAQTSADVSAPRVYSASEVDTHAKRIEDGTQPAYPDSLRPLGIDGKVLAQFVVDTAGMVDTTSILTEAYGQPLFAASVRQALATMHFMRMAIPLMRFVPARVDGRNVRELVRVPFSFSIEP
jgi:outer membrane biosynthesis protein TonB